MSYSCSACSRYFWSSGPPIGTTLRAYCRPSAWRRTCRMVLLAPVPRVPRTWNLPIGSAGDTATLLPDLRRTPPMIPETRGDGTGLVVKHNRPRRPCRGRAWFRRSPRHDLYLVAAVAEGIGNALGAVMADIRALRLPPL